MRKNKHLTLDERIDIQNDLNKNLSFKAIGAHLGKDCTTISKEIRNHILFAKKGAPYRKFNDCALIMEIFVKPARVNKSINAVHAVGVLNSVLITKNKNVLFLKSHHMYVTDVAKSMNVPLKNISMMPAMPRKNTRM